MIYIEERETQKVPGDTSFFIYFDYNKEIWNKLKVIKCKNYSKKSKEWELPVSELSNAINELSFLDDIKLNLLPEKNKTQEKIEIKSNFKTKPYRYQLEGIKFGLNHDKWLLNDVMGLGKTLQALYIAEELHNTKGLKHCLIICGVNSTKNNWKKEVLKHSSLDCVILGERRARNGNLIVGSIKHRINHLLSDIKEFFIITNIETIRNNDIVEILCQNKNNIDMIVVDEIHTCKDSQSHQGQNLLQLDSKYKIGMTGTPLMNNLIDIYLPLRWIDADKSTLTNFKSNYLVYSDQFNINLIGYKNTDMLKKQLSKNSLRRKKELLNMEPPTIIPEYIDMDEKHQIFYDNIKKGILEDVSKIKLVKNSVLGLITRLRQATASPSILTSEDIPSTKLNRAYELIEQIVANNEKVVVFSTFKESIYELEKKLKDYNKVVCTGDTKEFVFNENIDNFCNNDETKILLGTWQKCGTGIELQKSCNYMIFIDTPWTYSVFEQAYSRIHRNGNKNHVFVYMIICNNTIDEKVEELLAIKKSLSEYIVDDTLTESNIEDLRRYIEDLK